MSEQTFDFFCALEKIAVPRTPIQLKFGTLVGHPEATISINFGENQYKILRVIIDHLHKTRTMFRHAYRVNC